LARDLNAKGCSTPSSLRTINRTKSGNPFADVEASRSDDRGPPTLRTTIPVDQTGRRPSRTLMNLTKILVERMGRRPSRTLMSMAIL
jgi:hypothetical protein